MIMGENKKTLVVGLDAACWDYLDPLLDSGRMPTLKRLMATGVWGNLHSTMPPWTPTAWSSIITGKNPGKHGIFGMLWKRPGTYEFFPTNATLRIGRPFWSLLNDYGIKTGLVNIPFTYPPKPLDGFMVCGFGTPNLVSEIAYPTEVENWIREKFEDFKPEVEAEILATTPPDEIFLAEKKQQAIFVEIAGELANRHQVNVLGLNLMFPDHANHKMPEMEQVQEAYCQTDRDLSKLIKLFRPDNVMILSDHGSSRLKGDFMLDAWLRDQGYYVTLKNTPAERLAAFNWLLMHFFRGHFGWSGIKEKIIRRLVKESFFWFPEGMRERFWNRFEAVFPYARRHLVWSGKPNYTTTQVFPGSVYSGLLYLNVVDRDKKGVIPYEERKEIGREIAAKLIQIKDPEYGNPLFSNIYFAEDLYTGPEVRHAPDLILDAYQSGWNLRMRKDYFPSPPKAVVDRYFVTDSDQRDFGWHSREGIFVFSGPDFDKGKAPLNANLPDITATLLHLYGVPIPEDYDGVVRVATMIPAYRTRPIKYQPGDAAEREEKFYSPEEEEALVSHLRALGYLD